MKITASIMVNLMEEVELDINKLDTSVDKSKTFTKNEIITLASSPSYSLRDRALFTALYLSNSRVSEIVRRLRKNQIRFLELDGKEIMLFTELWTEKNKTHPLRVVPVNVERESILIEILKGYMLTIQEEDSLLFPISRQRAWSIVKRMSGERCHYLRHSRLSHLTIDGLPTEALKRLAGWSDARMLDTYSHLRWSDIARLMIA